jgi:hypothetical protein
MAHLLSEIHGGHIEISDNEGRAEDPLLDNRQIGGHQRAGQSTVVARSDQTQAFQSPPSWAIGWPESSLHLTQSQRAGSDFPDFFPGLSKGADEQRLPVVESGLPGRMAEMPAPCYQENPAWIQTP